MKSYIICLLFVAFAKASTENITDIGDFLDFITKALDELVQRVPLHPDTDLSISEILEKYGYPFEAHNVTTEDDYIITLHRIKHGRNETTSSNDTRPVVFLQHGLACSSMSFVHYGPGKAHAMLFADEGYDVWLGNVRGTMYSSHKTLTPSDSDYWEFGFHEKAVYDLATGIDYVINTTGQEQITLVAHSEGTTEGMVLTSIKPEYNDKINLMVLLSPIAYMTNITSPLPRFLAENMDLMKLVLDTLNIKGMPHSKILADLGKLFCNDASSLQDMCVMAVEFLVGFDLPQFNKTMLPVLINNSPSGISMKEIYHYGQAMNSGYFRQYDYGAIQNLIKYSSISPPSYDLSKITCPIASYYAQNDFFATVPNVEKLLEELPNKAISHLIEYELFNHLDFIYANDVKELLFDDMIEIVKQYSPLP